MTNGDRSLDRQIGEQCDVCGCRYRTLYKLSNDVWYEISPTSRKEGYLCISCADFRARKKGIELIWVARAKPQHLTPSQVSQSIYSALKDYAEG